MTSGRKLTIAEIEKAMDENPEGIEIQPDGTILGMYIGTMPEDPHANKLPEDLHADVIAEKEARVLLQQAEGSPKPGRREDGIKVPSQPQRAFVLHSGGIDSTTCLYTAVETYGAENVIALSFYYGQRHAVELDAAQKICDKVGCEHHIIKGIELPDSMLTRKDSIIPNVSYAELPGGVSPTYVPFRNGNLLSAAAAIAQAQYGVALYFGAHAEDANNWAYPDCTPEFIGSMANAIYVGTYHQVRLITPLEWLTKKDIIDWGTRMGVPWQLTWSCYKGESLQCGLCPTCQARRQGFSDAHVQDPTIYQSPLPIDPIATSDEIPF